MSSLEELRKLRDEWKAPPELRGSSRAVVMTANGKAVAMMAGFLVIAGVTGGVGLTVAAKRGEERKLRLIAEGLLTEGQIVKLTEKKGDDRECFVTFAFTAAGHRWERRAKVKCAIWTSMSVGAPIIVRYMPDDPATNRLENIERRGTIPYVVGPLLGVGALLGAALMWRLLMTRRRLLEEGRAAGARVVQHKKVPGKGVEIVFEYPTLSGSRVESKFGPVPTKSAPAVGSTFAVVYDKDEPRKAMRYPMDLYRVVH